MKIAVYFDLPAGGASRHVAEITKRLEKKHDIAVFHNLPQTFVTRKLNHLVSDIESIVIQRFKQYFQARQIDAGGYDLVFVSHDRHSQAPWILRYLKTPTVFLCQEPTRAYFEYFLRIDPKLPLINRLYESVNRYLRKQIEVGNARFACKIICNSLFSAESIFRAYGLSAHVIYPGVDTTMYYPVKSKKKNQILIVGNHEPQKALAEAVIVLSLVSKATRPGLLVISPRKVDNAELVKLAKVKKVKMKILSGISDRALRQAYSESILTLGLAHLEPFGLSVVESLACGTPVIAVNEGGFRETVAHGRTGILIEREPQKIAQAIQSLIEDRSKLTALGERGKKVVHHHFTWDRSYNQFERIFYENLRHHR